MVTFLWHNRMAARVALEIQRVERLGVDQIEGLAYKAEWDGRGSDSINHCISADTDRAVMSERVSMGRGA